MGSGFMPGHNEDCKSLNVQGQEEGGFEINVTC